MKNKSTIEIQITLDENKIPDRIQWRSDDGQTEFSDSKAFFMSLFDAESLETLKLDLWTKTFGVDEMNQLVFHTLRGLADSYFKATNNNELATQMQQFAQFFAEKTNMISSNSESDKTED